MNESARRINTDVFQNIRIKGTTTRDEDDVLHRRLELHARTHARTSARDIR